VTYAGRGDISGASSAYAGAIAGSMRHASGVLEVKVLDLGLAKFGTEEPLATDTVTAEGVVMGTVGYMSPEQLMRCPLFFGPPF
jgi:serine/threonine protein kinase